MRLVIFPSGDMSVPILGGFAVLRLKKNFLKGRWQQLEQQSLMEGKVVHRKNERASSLLFTIIYFILSIIYIYYVGKFSLPKGSFFPSEGEISPFRRGLFSLPERKIFPSV